MSNTNFKIGDKVSDHGAVGTVISIEGDYVDWLDVEFDRVVVSYRLDGRREIWHTEPSLVFLERPKRKVTKTIERWAVVNPRSDKLLGVYLTYEMASKYNDTADVVKLTGEYTVEVDGE